MRKVALIVFNEEGSKRDESIMGTLSTYLKRKFRFLIPNKIENYIIEQDNMSFYVLRMPDQESVATRLEKVLVWIEEEGVSVAAFDENIMKEFGREIRQRLEGKGVSICDGSNLFFAVSTRILKKLMKAKGIDINEVEMAIISDGNSPLENEFIEYLAPQVKYLTYVTKESAKVRKLIDDIFLNSGFAIRVCNDIKECKEDVSLIINFTKQDIAAKNFYTKKKVLIYNMESASVKGLGNLVVLNDILIDISSLGFGSEIKNKHKYSIAEAYIILSKLNKESLFKQRPDERDFKEIYEHFKNSSFKITKFEGVNL